MRKIKENRKMKKTVIFLVLSGIIAQGLTSCTMSSEADKEEMRQEMSQARKELESEFDGMRKELSEILDDPDSEPTDTEEKNSADYQARAEEISALFIENFGLSTVQYTLMDGDEIILSNMTGVNDALNKPVFCMASSSKVYVTAAVMMLVDQGKIDLDTPVVQYMPEFTMADERYKEITPRMLLNHSSGLYGTSMLYGNSTSLDAPSTVGRDAFFELKKEETLKADPGEIAVYCNDGFILSEFLVEKVSSMTYTDFIKDNIAKPLGLTYTTTTLDPDLKKEDITPGLNADGEPMPIEYMNYPGTGGIYSTTEEMCKFARLYMGDHPEILSEKSAQMTMEPEFKEGIWVDDVPNFAGYGLGWDNVSIYPLRDYGIRAVSKGGDATFHHANLTVLPDHNISMAVLTAGGSSFYNAMFSSEVILSYLVSKGVIESIQEESFEPAAPVKTDMPEELKKYEGLYGTGTMSGQTILLTIDDSELSLSTSVEGMVFETYVYTGNNEFTSNDGPMTVYFKEESNGQTYLVQKVDMGSPELGPMLTEWHVYQKLEPQQLSESVKSAWQTRMNKNYMRVNEMFNSSDYLDGTVMIYRSEIDLETGYISGTRIVDTNKAVNVFQIPIMNGRDSYDMNFYESNGKNYLNKYGQIFIDEEHVVPFDITKAVVIGADGFAEWFVIDENAAEKEIRVSIPEKSAVHVYDENLASYVLFIDSGEQTFTLPAGGFIVFAGDAGAEFKLGS